MQRQVGRTPNTSSDLMEQSWLVQGAGSLQLEPVHWYAQLHVQFGREPDQVAAWLEQSLFVHEAALWHALPA